MITDKEAKNAVNTIIQYCHEIHTKESNKICYKCVLLPFCRQIDDEVYCNDEWLGYLKDFQGF